MYHKGIGTGTAGVAVLPFTGVVHLGWQVLTAVTLIGFGGVILRLVPRKES